MIRTQTISMLRLRKPMTNDSHQAKLNTLTSQREPDEHAHRNIQSGRNPNRRSETAIVENQKAREKGAERRSESIGEIENAHRDTEIAEGPDHVRYENWQCCAHECRRDQQQSEVHHRDDGDGAMNGASADRAQEPGAASTECSGDELD